MLESVDKDIFLKSKSIKMTPYVSAEWNQNLFNSPYFTVAGNGTKIIDENVVVSSQTVPTTVTGDLAKPNFTTKSFSIINGKGSVSYTVTAPNTAKAYKVVTYVKSDTRLPIMLNLHAEGTSTQFGSKTEDINFLGWTKMEMYIGSSGGIGDTISSFTYTISTNPYDPYEEDSAQKTVYFTFPEFYETTYFDYQNHSLWPTDSVFTFFRPGESYINTGNSSFSFPSGYRIKTKSDGKYMPQSSIIQNPTSILLSAPESSLEKLPEIKFVAPSDTNPYKYFVSDKNSKSISALYEKEILVNKIIIKLNTAISTQVISINIDGEQILVDGTDLIGTDSPSFNGETIILYWTGLTWTRNKWTEMPTFDLYGNGDITKKTSFKKITVNLEYAWPKDSINEYLSDYASQDNHRLHLIEISPRLEIDLSNYIQDVSINKSLDSKNNLVPISSMNSNDASITLSGIPLFDVNDLENRSIPLFSNQSNNGKTILASMLKKNIKLYLHYNLDSYSHPDTNIMTTSNTLIPGGVFYSDTWSESDVDTVSIQAFDSTRFLQSMPVPDYVANLRTPFEIMTNILELAGFTDYDYDSLYNICNDKAHPLEISYFFCNSKDSTIIETLSELFLVYQIGAYIDEYGIMRFLSLHNIIEPKNAILNIDEKIINDGGYSTDNKSKIGKVSIRYQSPKIRQSPAMQNVTDPAFGESPSFVYTTANTVVWSQESMDSVGFNYLVDTMQKEDTSFQLDTSDLLDIFHTFSLNNNGYAVIENEVVSLDYKQYTISQAYPANSRTVSVKNDLELSAAINSFIKDHQTGLVPALKAEITAISGSDSVISVAANNSFAVGQKVMISGVRPSGYNVIGKILSVLPTSFTVSGEETRTFDPIKSKNPTATVASGYDIIVSPTGKITNVKRGLFGSKVSSHIYGDGPISSRNLSEKSIGEAYLVSDSSSCSILGDEIPITAPPGQKIIIFPTSERDIVFKKTIEDSGTYGTYSTKIKFSTSDTNTLPTAAAGLFFNMQDNMQDLENTCFVELIRYKTTDEITAKEYTKYAIATYYYNGLEAVVLAWADVTSLASSIIRNFEKTFEKQGTDNKYSYSINYDEVFHLRVAKWEERTTDNGENPGTLLSVFLNNIEINNWQVNKFSQKTPNYLEIDSVWESMPRNDLTKVPQKISIPDTVIFDENTIFGSYMTTRPVNISEIAFITENSTKPVGAIREIYATQKPLRERSVNYYFQDKEFLNSIVQNKNIFASSKAYMMQTKPQISGINYYDVQYTTPAAISADINPIQYLWRYFPGSSTRDQNYAQTQLVDEYSLGYSTVLNTGFRARMAIANNSRHMVFLKHDADQISQFTNALTLWTHEIIAPSDPEILEKVLDPANSGEIAQLDSSWIQSKGAAEKLLYVIAKSIDGFSQNTTLEIFGNPLIQVGDVISVSYPLAGIVSQKYVVVGISHSFNNGFGTSLSLNRV